MGKPDTIIVSREVFEVLSEVCGFKDDATRLVTNRKARRAREAEVKKRVSKALVWRKK